MKDTGSDAPGRKRRRSSFARLRSTIASLIGVAPERKESLYLDLARGSTLFDLVYWLQIIFSSGIATLGLVMNSPAVIIGAMLISPLMGPILAGGLSLASGDLVLGIRSAAKVALSALSAVVFSLTLVIILPFRELTSEIAARTEPNTLDLVIALFSGAVGSIAVCRDVKGVATSIPGVAIAVALMPPLCVAGYGLGLMITFDVSVGWRAASGGGLLFLTNLVAITLTAMIVFLAVKLSTAGVRQRAEEWEQADPESAFILSVTARFPRIEQAREIRSLPVRFSLILVPLIAILIPLGQSFARLQNEIFKQRQENVVKREVMSVWQQQFQRNATGAVRSTIDHMTVTEKDGTVEISMRLFDDEPYTAAEKGEFARLVASRLGRAPESISLRITEIPTASSLSSLRDIVNEPKEPTLAELQSALSQKVDAAMLAVRLPEGAELIGRELIVNTADRARLKITYLYGETLQTEVRDSVIDVIRSELKDPTTEVDLERIPTDIGSIDFLRRSASIPILGLLQLDFVGRVMRENTGLVLEVTSSEAGSLEDERFSAIVDYLESKWQISRDRVVRSEIDEQAGGRTRLRFQMKGGQPPEAQEPQAAP